MTPLFNIFSLRPSVLAVCLALGSPVLMQTTFAQSSQSATQVFDIPAGPLDATLTRIARQSGQIISIQPEQVQARKAPAIRGEMSADQAYRQALQGTDLELVVSASGALNLRPVPAKTVSTLPAITATASQETATGPFVGYAARRSATGTKTDTPIIETPQSITVIGAQEIETLKSQSLQDALGYVAGVSRAEGMDRTTDSLFLRGFRTSLGNYYRDGTLYTVNIYNGRQEPYGLERIEYLKGASSVLYGATPPGGVISTISKRPVTEPLRELNVEMGSFDRKQLSGDFGGALNEDGKWSYRLTALRRDSNTFVDYVPDDRTYVAPAIKWQPNAGTSLTLLGEYQRDHTAYAYGLPAQGTVLPNPNGRIPRDRFGGEPGFDRFDLKRTSIGYVFEHAFNDRLILRNNLRYIRAESGYDSTSIWQLAPDLRHTASRTASPRWDLSTAFNVDTSLQYKVETGAIQHTVLAGFDYSLPKHETKRYLRRASSIDLYDPVYGGTMGPITPNYGSSTKSDTRRMGVYIQDQMKIEDKWVVLLGGRQDWVRASESNVFTGEQYADNEKSQAFTGRAGLVYLAENGLAPFVSYSQSFEPTSGQDREGSRFKPTEGEQYELGLRYQPAGSDTMLSASVYTLTRKNVTVADPMDTSYQIQTGKARSRGVELEARTRIGRNTNLIAAYAYTDARTLKASPLQPDAEGRRLDSVPLNQFSIWSDYGFGSFGLPGLRVGAGVRYVGSTYGMAHGTRVEVPAFTLMDAMLSFSRDRWKFALNATNLADKTYIGSCTYGCFYGEPRKLISTVTYRW
ncbi:TonB-dependent siderophore receptor [Herminiimonas glaciei]|uniref:TonB-dependent siderophore receptor n=1 Tax=Herminiimonas glaciei TaxID=523788 RepID=A0ABW2I7Y5_9BURK